MPGQARLRAECPPRLCLRHDEARTLRRHVQRPDARGLRRLKARARDDCGGRILAEPLLLLPRRPRRRGQAILRQSAARRASCHELSGGAAEQAPACNARFCRQTTASPWSVEEGDRERLRRVGFTDRDIWDISAITGFFNMSNRVASATDMRPNMAYHGQAR